MLGDLCLSSCSVLPVSSILDTGSEVSLCQYACACVAHCVLSTRSIRHQMCGRHLLDLWVCLELVEIDMSEMCMVQQWAYLCLQWLCSVVTGFAQHSASRHTAAASYWICGCQLSQQIRCEQCLVLPSRGAITSQNKVYARKLAASGSACCCQQQSIIHSGQ